MVFAGDEVTIDTPGTGTAQGTCRLDAKKRPKEIDTIDSKNETLLGVYELKGDTLRICFGKSKRPKALGIQGEAFAMLMVLKRATPAQAAKEEAVEGPASRSQDREEAEHSNSYSVRKWTNSSGKYTVEAEFVKFSDNIVTLKKADGKVISFPLEKLSATDRSWVKRAAAHKGGSAREEPHVGAQGKE